MSDISNRNTAAVKVALQNQNKKIDELQTKMVILGEQLFMMNAELGKLREWSLQQIAEKFGHGPTA